MAKLIYTRIGRHFRTCFSLCKHFYLRSRVLTYPLPRLPAAVFTETLQLRTVDILEVSVSDSAFVSGARRQQKRESGYNCLDHVSFKMVTCDIIMT